MGDGLSYNIYNLFVALSVVTSFIIFLGSMSFIGMDPLALVAIGVKRIGLMASNTISSIFAEFFGLI